MKLRTKMVIVIVNVLAMIVGMLIFSVRPHMSIDEKLELSATLPLEKDKYPEVTELVTKLINAKFKMDMNTLKECMNDINVEDCSEEELKKQNAYIESIEGITCYTIDGYYDDSYIAVAVKREKIKNMDVVVPTIVMYYVCEYEGKLVVYSGTAEGEIGTYLENAMENPEVEKLVKQVKDERTGLEEKYPEYKILIGAATPTPKPTPTPAPKSTNKDESVG